MCRFFASELGLGSKEGISPVSVPSAITSTVQVKSRPYLLTGPRISDRLGKCMCYSFSINNQRSSFSCCIKGSPQWIIYLHLTLHLPSSSVTTTSYMSFSFLLSSCLAAPHLTSCIQYIHDPTSAHFQAIPDLPL